LIASNALGFYRANAGRYPVYRVFRFRAAPRVLTLHGGIDVRCILKASQFLAMAKSHAISRSRRVRRRTCFNMRLR
jgi:hypothetical protein